MESGKKHEANKHRKWKETSGEETWKVERNMWGRNKESVKKHVAKKHRKWKETCGEETWKVETLILKN